MFKGMSEQEQLLYFKLGESDTRIFTISDIVSILNVSDPQARNIASSLVRKKIVDRIKPGLFARVPESVILSKDRYREDSIYIASRLVDEYYLSHLTATFIHGISNTLVNTIYVTSPTHQRNIQYHDIKIRFVSVSQQRMFGIETIEYFKKEVQVSDLERTIIDIVDRPNLSGGWYEVIQSLKNVDEIDTEKLVEYLTKFRKKKTTRIAGYLLEHLGLGSSMDFHSRLMSISGNSRFYVDRTREGEMDKRWNLIVPNEVVSGFND